MEDRLAELEVRFTLQQDVLDKLSEVLWKQQRTIEELTARVAALESGRVADGDGGDAEAPDDPPPHY